MISPFNPAPWLDREQYEGAAKELLPKLAAAKTEVEREVIISELREIFHGSQGVIEVEEGRVGFSSSSVTNYNPDIIRSMLPSHAGIVIAKSGKVIAHKLEELVNKLRKAGILDREYAKGIIKSGRSWLGVTFVAEPADDSHRRRWEQDHARLDESKPVERFKGYSI